MMRCFELHRDIDETGVSGTGVVVEGVEFTSGRTVITWVVKDKPSSVASYDSFDDMYEVHGHGGKTRVVWVTPAAGARIGNYRHDLG